MEPPRPRRGATRLNSRGKVGIVQQLDARLQETDAPRLVRELNATVANAVAASKGGKSTVTVETVKPGEKVPESQPAPRSAVTPAPAAKPAPASAPASKPAAAQQTRPANSSGMVWVNTDSGVYHKPGTRYYGKTKQGKYMSEADAIKAGYRAAGKK